MKKILLFFVIAGIALGIFIGIRTFVLNSQNTDEKEEEIEEEYVDKLNLALIEVDTLNPLFTKNKQVSDTLKLIYEPLININEDNNLEPCLAIEWMQKDDLTWVVKLRNDILWHSTKDFSADDVVFTIDTLINHIDETIYKSNVENISYAEKIDSNSVAIYLKQEDNDFAYKLTFPIIPKYYWLDDLYNLEKSIRPIGTGPYTFNSIDSETELIKLVYNNNWWSDENVKLKTIYLYRYGTFGEAIKAFKSGNIDVINTTMTTWEKKFGTIGINYYKYENDEFETLIPNNKNVALSENSVRRAILQSINRENIILNVYNGSSEAQDMPIHSYSWLYDGSMNAEYDIEKAKQLLINATWKQQGGTWVKNINGRQYSLRFNLLVNKDQEEKCRVAEMIKDDLSNVGIKITIQKVDFDTFKDRIAEDNFDLALGSLTLQTDMDVISLIQNESDLNYANYSSVSMDEILRKISLENIEFENLYKDLQAKYKLESPYIGLYFKTNTLLTNKAVKGDIKPTWWNAYNKVWTWSK